MSRAARTHARAILEELVSPDGPLAVLANAPYAVVLGARRNALPV